MSSAPAAGRYGHAANHHHHARHHRREDRASRRRHRLGFEAFDRIDACVLGRLMYPEYEEYWRGVVAGADDAPEAKRYAEFADRTPHYVLTNTVTDFDWPVAQPVSDIDEIAALRNEPARDIYVVGGATTVRSFINAGLLDELRLTVHPLLVAEGASLFDGVSGDHRYDVTDIQRLDDGAVRMVYDAKRAPEPH